MSKQTFKESVGRQDGQEPMTNAQLTYLRTLSGEAHETFDEKMTQSQASERIDDLQIKTGRARD